MKIKTFQIHCRESFNILVTNGNKHVAETFLKKKKKIKQFNESRSKQKIKRCSPQKYIKYEN